MRWLFGNGAVLRSRAPSRWLRAAVDLRRHAARLDASRDVVWVQYGGFFDLLLLALARRAHAGRVLCTVHVGRQWRHRRWPGMRALALRLLRLADVVCVLSRSEEAHLRGLGFANVVRIPTLLPAWIHTVEPASVREGLLFAGRIAPEKGVEDLIRCLARADAPRTTLDVLGGGDAAYLARLARLARELGIAGNVRWLGACEEAGVGALMSRRRVLVYPSRADAFPLSLLEAFSAGMSVVAYDLPGTTEILRDHGGIPVPEGDLDRLTRSMREAVEGAARPAPGTTRHLRWEFVVPRYLEVAFGGGA